jgi:hypothetical protein
MGDAGTEHKARRRISMVLVVIAAILAPFVITSSWAIATVTNTNRFTSTMSEVASNPTVTNYAAAESAAAIVNALDINKKLEQYLPSAASSIGGSFGITKQIDQYLPFATAFIAPYLDKQLTSRLTNSLSQLYQQPWFQKAFTTRIRLLHGTVVKLLTGTGGKHLNQAAKLVVDYTPQINEAISKLDAQGITVFDPVRTALNSNRRVLLTLADDQQFSKIQGYFNLALKLRWILPIIWLAIAIAAVLVDPKRRRSGRRLAFGVMIASAVMLAFLDIGNRYFQGHSPTPPDVADVIFSVLTSLLRWEFRIAIILGAIVAIVLWVTGDTPRAVGLRGRLSSGSEHMAERVRSASDDSAIGKVRSGAVRTLEFCATHATGFIWTGVTVALLLLAWVVTSVGGVVVTLVLLAAWVLGVLAVKRAYSPRPPEPSELTAGAGPAGSHAADVPAPLAHDGAQEGTTLVETRSDDAPKDVEGPA